MRTCAPRGSLSLVLFLFFFPDLPLFIDCLLAPLRPHSSEVNLQSIKLLLQKCGPSLWNVFMEFLRDPSFENLQGSFESIQGRFENTQGPFENTQGPFENMPRGVL